MIGVPVTDILRPLQVLQAQAQAQAQDPQVQPQDHQDHPQDQALDPQAQALHQDHHPQVPVQALVVPGNVGVIVMVEEEVHAQA